MENGCDCRKKNLSQWFFKITHYAEELLNDLNELEQWPDKVKTMQKNWIGKSIGAEINFKINELNKTLKIFTTRPDTIYGATFIAVSINHSVVRDLLNDQEILKIKEKFNQTENDKEKVGIPLKNFIENPISKSKIPVFIANFVLDNYGEGAIFGCPAHDERDFEFAKKYNLPIQKVIDCPDQQLPYSGDGIVINSPYS